MNELAQARQEKDKKTTEKQQFKTQSLSQSKNLTESTKVCYVTSYLVMWCCDVTMLFYIPACLMTS